MGIILACVPATALAVGIAVINDIGDYTRITRLRARDWSWRNDLPKERARACGLNK